MGGSRIRGRWIEATLMELTQPDVDSGAVRNGANGDQASVIDAMRRAIVHGDLPAGQRLTEIDLCERYDVSRATIRLVLFELAKEGLVTHEANRGSWVRSLSLPEAIHILQVRMAIESHFAGLAAEQATAADLDELRTLAGEMANHVRSNDIASYDDANTRLHEKVLSISGNAPAADIVSHLRNQSARQQFRIHMRRSRHDASLAEHVEIVDAIVARDAARACGHGHSPRPGHVGLRVGARRRQRPSRRALIVPTVHLGVNCT